MNHIPLPPGVKALLYCKTRRVRVISAELSIVSFAWHQAACEQCKEALTEENRATADKRAKKENRKRFKDGTFSSDMLGDDLHLTALSEPAALTIHPAGEDRERIYQAGKGSPFPEGTPVKTLGTKRATEDEMFVIVWEAGPRKIDAAGYALVDAALDFFRDQQAAKKAGPTAGASASHEGKVTEPDKAANAA